MSLLLVYALLSLSTERMVFGLTLPPTVPLWAGLLGLVVIYHVLTAPMKMARYAASRAAGGWYSPWANVMESAFSVLFLGLAYYYLPEVRILIDAILTVLRDLSEAHSKCFSTTKDTKDTKENPNGFNLCVLSVLGGEKNDAQRRSIVFLPSVNVCARSSFGFCLLITASNTSVFPGCTSTSSRPLESSRTGGPSTTS